MKHYDILSICRYVDNNDIGWVRCMVKSDKTYTFVTNGRKLYRSHAAHNKVKALKRIDCVEFDKCDIKSITEKLAKYHPDTPELEIMQSIHLDWLFIGIYKPYEKQIIRYFFTQEQPNVVYGSGATHIDDDYVLYSTARLGLCGNPTYEDLMDDKTKMDSFLQRELNARCL